MYFGQKDESKLEAFRRTLKGTVGSLIEGDLKKAEISRQKRDEAGVTAELDAYRSALTNATDPVTVFNATLQTTARLNRYGNLGAQAANQVYRVADLWKGMRPEKAPVVQEQTIWKKRGENPEKYGDALGFWMDEVSRTTGQKTGNEKFQRVGDVPRPPGGGGANAGGKELTDVFRFANDGTPVAVNDDVMRKDRLKLKAQYDTDVEQLLRMKISKEGQKANFFPDDPEIADIDSDIAQIQARINEKQQYIDVLKKYSAGSPEHAGGYAGTSKQKRISKYTGKPAGGQ